MIVPAIAQAPNPDGIFLHKSIASVAFLLMLYAIGVFSYVTSALIGGDALQLG